MNARSGSRKRLVEAGSEPWLKPGPTGKNSQTKPCCFGSVVEVGCEGRAVSSLSPTQRVLRESFVTRCRGLGLRTSEEAAGWRVGERGRVCREPEGDVSAWVLYRAARPSTLLSRAPRCSRRGGAWLGVSDRRPMQMTSRLAPRAQRTLATRLLGPGRSVEAVDRGQRPAWIVVPGAGVDGRTVSTSGAARSAQLRETGRRA